MKRFSFILSLMIFFIAAGAQTKFSFSGKVSDVHTGQPLAGASVYFSDLKKGAISGESGIFIVTSLPAGQYLMEISFLGYSTIIEAINFTSDIKKDYALSVSVIENEGVTVTGVASATSIKKTPIPVNIIRREDMLRNTSTNLIDNIARVPGVSQVSTGPAVSKPFIRGLGYNRVIIVNDGIRHEGQQWGDEHGVEIDELSANRVEVLKGPASLMYGSDALAGVLNIISVQPAPEGTIKGIFLAGYQSNNHQRNFHLGLGGNNNGLIWGAYSSLKAASDYRNKYDGYVFNSKFNEKNFGGYFGLNKGWGFSHLIISNYKQEFGLVDGDRDNATGKFIKQVNDSGTEVEQIATKKDFISSHPFIPRQHLQHFKVILDNSIKIGKNRITAVMGYQRDQRKEIGNVLDPSEKSLYFDLDIFNYNLQYHLPEKNNWRSTIGINGMQETNHNRGLEALIPEYSLFDIGGFFFSQKKIREITVSGGIRWDSRSIDSKKFMEGPAIKFNAFKKDFSNLSGSLGLTWQASKKVNFKFNIAHGFRAPGIPELSSNGTHEGTNRFEYGELNLRSETSWQGDAGIELGAEHISLNGSLFVNGIRNFIYYRKLESIFGGDSIIVIGPDQFFAFRYAQDNACLYGAEFNVDMHPHPLDWLHIENTFSWVIGVLSKEQDGSKNLPYIPAARLINELKVDLLKKGKTLRNFFITAELDNTFSQENPFTGYDTETATKGYSLLNAGIGGEFRSKDKTIFILLFSANNIGNAAYQNHLSRLKYAPENMVTGRTGVFNMGRSFTFKLNVPLHISIRHK